MKSSAFTLMLLAILMTIPVFVFAQPRPPSTPVPLDGGILTLMAAGAIYGSRLYHKRKP